MTGGVAFESIHQAGGLGTPIVVVLNDNGMSISPNVGALSRSFNRMRLHRGAWKRREEIEHALTELPGGIGGVIEKVGPSLKDSLKSFVNHGALWEELDWAYLGVIDGHDIKTLRKALTKALDAGRPVVVHVATVKGKGFAPAEDGGLEGQERWHAAKPKSIIERAPAPPVEVPADAPVAPPAYTDVFGAAMVDEVRRDPRIVGITAAMNSGTGLSRLQREIPDHYFDVGIAEQNALLFAAGLALEGIKPVAAIYSTFLQRAYDRWCTIWACRSCRSCSPWIALGSWATTVRRTTASSISPTCAPCPTSCWPRRAMRQSSCTCCAPPSPGMRARSAFGIRAAPPWRSAPHRGACLRDWARRGAAVRRSRGARRLWLRRPAGA